MEAAGPAFGKAELGADVFKSAAGEVVGFEDDAIAFRETFEGEGERGFLFGFEESFFGGVGGVDGGPDLVRIEGEHVAGDGGADVAVEFVEVAGALSGLGGGVGEVLIDGGLGLNLGLSLMISSEPSGFADGIVDGAADAVVGEGFELDTGAMVKGAGGFGEAEFGGAFEFGTFDVAGQRFQNAGGDGVGIGEMSLYQTMDRSWINSHKVRVKSGCRLA